jgi:non-specific serine/threonine protein kinase
MTRWVYGLVLAANHHIEELSFIADSLVADDPKNLCTVTILFLKHALLGAKAEALMCVTPELEAAARWDEVYHWLLAEGHALINEKDTALDWLELAISRGFINFPFLSEHDPLLDNLRGEERFEKLMERAKHERETLET